MAFEEIQSNTTFFGKSKIMQGLSEECQILAKHSLPVFISGDTGTGKEVAARYIHDISKRRNKPFIAFHCGAYNAEMIDSALFGHVKGAYTNAIETRDGAITLAQGGTLFLDEIGDMPLPVQIKLLRFTQDLHYQKLGSNQVNKANIRIICATNKNIKSLINSYLFREDLYYRLNTNEIYFPSLKERENDVIDLAWLFLNSPSNLNHTVIKISSCAKKLLKTYHWPGNVRELKNIMLKIRKETLSSKIYAADFPISINNIDHKYKLYNDNDFVDLTKMPLWKSEKTIIERTILHCNGNIEKAAGILEISASTIYRKKQKWTNSV